jgi:hypothetical protein
MAKGFLSGFKGIDAFGKVRTDYIEVATGKTDHVCIAHNQTTEDVKVKTRTGALRKPLREATTMK